MTNGARNRILVVSSTRPTQKKQDTIWVGTPLEVISLLEHDRELISTVILAGRFATNRELANFLSESYPSLSIVSSRHGEEPDAYLPAYA